MNGTLVDNPIARRREAGAFLRARRGRLAPSDAGLPAGFRRRTPGLRREEVAMLAGVGTTWYTWLEQGREVQPSSEVLRALADVLQLDPVERQHLFSLYDRTTPEQRSSSEEQVDEALQRMVDGLAEQPVLVLGWRWDVLAWNRAAEVLLGPFPPFERDRLNVLELLLAPSARKLFVDWESTARGALTAFRAECAPYVGDPEFEDLVARLTRVSLECATWWSQHDVAHRLAGRKRLNHPTVGLMHFDFSMLAIGGRPGMKLCVFTAVDKEDTARKLSQLLAKVSADLR